MNLTPVGAAGPLLTWLKIIAAALALLALGACSAVRIGYGQAPNLIYWWMDGYADLNDIQSAQVRRDIDRFMAWHREQELPRYAGLLQRWQEMSQGDVTPEAVCRQYDELREAWVRMTEQAGAPLVQLAVQLDGTQMAHFERHQHKSQESFEKDFVRGTPEQRLKRRTDRVLDRYETLFGSLSPAQEAMIRQALAQSPFDPQLTRQERLRVANELRGMIRQWQTMPAGAAQRAQAQRQAGEWLARRLPPSHATDHPTARVIRHGCEMYAALHNSTSGEQRAHALRVLKDYEADFRSLAGQD
jgi:Family of unknown function (DUF6279)